MIQVVAVRKTYNQNCPVALGLDIIGERWTLLFLRELVGGSRRYSDLRSELPGIATNLLADRLRALEQADLIYRTEMPPPIARTVYQLSDAGWRKFTPGLQAIANFGMDQFDVNNAARTPLTVSTTRRSQLSAAGPAWLTSRRTTRSSRRPMTSCPIATRPLNRTST